MTLVTAMYYSAGNPLEKVPYESDKLSICKDIDQRRLQKACLRYHDARNWPMLREALQEMGRADLVGDGGKCLIPGATPSKRSTNNRHRHQAVILL